MKTYICKLTERNERQHHWNSYVFYILGYDRNSNMSLLNIYYGVICMHKRSSETIFDWSILLDLVSQQIVFMFLLRKNELNLVFSVLLLSM